MTPLFYAVVVFSYYGWPEKWVYPIESKAEACATATVLGTDAVVYGVGDSRKTEWLVMEECK